MELLAGYDFVALGLLAGALLLTGVIAGVLAGLLGVGGGIVIVPVLFHLFTLLGIDEAVRMHLAVGTSLATIIPTSIRSIRAHHEKGAVDFDLLKGLGLPILAGVALTSLTGARTALALNLSHNPFAAYELVTWMLGSLTDRSMVHVTLAAPFIAAGWVMLLLAAPALDALSLGEEAAQSMGADLRRTRILIIGGTALCVGAATAVSGVIGFIGLIVPHLLRPLVGHRPSLLLPVSALGGVLLLLLADILVRLITPGTELKLGVVTALIGAPFFLWLILKTRSSAS